MEPLAGARLLGADLNTEVERLHRDYVAPLAVPTLRILREVLRQAQIWNRLEALSISRSPGVCGGHGRAAASEE